MFPPLDTYTTSYVIRSTHFDNIGSLQDFIVWGLKDVSEPDHNA